MQDPSRRIRGLAYVLTDLATHLRAAGRASAAETVGLAAAKIGPLDAVDFLDESRSALEAVLLGERDLPMQALAEILDAMSAIDDLYRATQY